MSIHLNPKHIVWDEFGGLEAPQPEWADQFDYWRDYNFKFFQSNGLKFDPADNNVEAWLMSPDRAPFSAMVEALLPRLGQQVELDKTQAILMAHWLPDLHLGTSVTNFMMHKLGLEDCFGFAISDRGLSAPFFAFDSLVKYLSKGKQRGMLAIADQKHIMYRSELVARLNPVNTACLLHIDTENSEGMRYAGYARQLNVAPEDTDKALDILMDELGLEPTSTRIIASDEIQQATQSPRDFITSRTDLVCSAPFAALAQIQDHCQSHMLVCRDDSCLTALGFEGVRS